MTHVSIWMKYIKQPLWRHIEIARTMISCSCEIAPKIYIIFVTHITVNVSNGFHFHPPTTSMRCFWLLFVCLTYQKSTWNTESKRQKNCSSISECGMFCLFLDVDVQLLFHTRLSFINRKIACRYSKWLPEENKYYDGNRIWRMINVVWNGVPKIFCLAHHSIDHNLNYTMFGKKKKLLSSLSYCDAR